jgi:hypothetical protein
MPNWCCIRAHRLLGVSERPWGQSLRKAPLELGYAWGSVLLANASYAAQDARQVDLGEIASAMRRASCPATGLLATARREPVDGLSQRV